MSGTQLSAETVGYLNNIGRGAFCFGRSFNENENGLSRSENVGLSNVNIGENPIPRKPKGSFTRFVHEG